MQALQAGRCHLNAKRSADTRYRVVQPLLVWTGKTAPWFDEPGGATQFQDRRIRIVAAY